MEYMQYEGWKRGDQHRTAGPGADADISAQHFCLSF